VVTESKDPNSTLSFYKKVLALRHTNPALLEGNYTALNTDDMNVMSYLRSYKNKAVLVALNMSASPQKVTFNLADKGFASANFKTLLATPQTSANDADVTLEPFGIFIGEAAK
jgi:glycosidase